MSDSPRRIFGSRNARAGQPDDVRARLAQVLDEWAQQRDRTDPVQPRQQFAQVRVMTAFNDGDKWPYVVQLTDGDVDELRRCLLGQ